MDSLLFYPLALLAIGAAIGMLRSKDAVHSALFMILNFITIAVLYILLDAPFISMVQITVYAGAIMVLFLFVIMLLGAEQLRGVFRERSLQSYVAAGMGIAVVVFGGLALAQSSMGSAASLDGFKEEGFGAPADLGMRLFEGYILPFELTGFLLLTAIVGVVVLDRRRKKDA